MDKRMEKDGYVFDFSDDIVDIISFDENEKLLCDGMKSVDIIAEFPNEYLFLELKKYKDRNIDFKCPLWKEAKVVSNCPLLKNERISGLASINRIAKDLRQKYFDTFLYRHINGRNDKPISYICVAEGCDSALTTRLKDKVSIILPLKRKMIKENDEWNYFILKNFAVVNVKSWNNSSHLNRYARCSVVE